MSISLKIHFPRWPVGHYEIIPVTFRSGVLYEIDFMYSTKESENKDSECIFCKRKFSEDEGEKNLYTVLQQFSVGAPDCTASIESRVCLWLYRNRNVFW